MSDGADFIGRGILWPLRVDQTGSIALGSGADDINASLRMAIMTAPGERVMRPQFGCRIWELLFEPINELPPKTEAVFKVTVKARGTGDVRFKVEMTSKHLNSPVTKEESTRLYGE